MVSWAESLQPEPEQQPERAPPGSGKPGSNEPEPAASVAAGRFALTVGLKRRPHDPERADSGGGELAACRAWLEKAEAELPQETDGRCGSLGLKKLQLGSRLSALVLVSSFLSLTPVLCPFGDPYDLTARGFARNAGYFLVYCGFGWAQLWLAMTLWAHRIIGIDFSMWRTVALPTAGPAVTTTYFTRPALSGNRHRSA